MTRESSLNHFLKANTLQKKAIQSGISKLSMIRLIAFLLLVAGVSMSFDGEWVQPARYLSCSLFILFLFLLKRHDVLFQKLAVREEFMRQAKNDLARLECQFDKIEDPLPEGLFHGDHPYAHDLDFHAPNSIFKLFGDTFHLQAVEKLGSWFNYNSETQSIRERQDAIAEMAEHPKLMRHFLCNNRLFSKAKWRVEDLKEWTEIKTPKYLGLMLFTGIPLALISTGCLFAAFFLGMATPWLPFLSLQVVFLVIVSYYLKPFIIKYLIASPVMGASASNLLSFSQKTWESTELKRMKSGLGMDRDALNASEEVNKAVFQALSVRKNGFAYLTLNLLFQWDVIYAYRLSKWKNQTNFLVTGWLDSLFYLEALSSLAYYSYLFPQNSFPKIVDGRDIELRTVALGHPCISQEMRVCNDYQLVGKGKTQLLTGSNMSGKSTFLRTVGINWALALAGAPCCAMEMICTNVPIWTSMRIQDSLAQGTSYFYAEVKRLKAILDQVDKKAQPVFFLLDEILKGTNSRERFLATRALVVFLREGRASGVISTHDLELLKLTGQGVENYHFSEMIDHDEMTFDYLLKKGQLESTNALKVIKMVGLPLSFDL